MSQLATRHFLHCIVEYRGNHTFLGGTIAVADLGVKEIVLVSRFSPLIERLIACGEMHQLWKPELAVGNHLESVWSSTFMAR